jgi:small nuclear ribonucleoprotein (snRNP)-like protein
MTSCFLGTKANLFSTSFFKTLVDHEVTVELKNDIQIRGTLKSVDQYLNIKLDDITVVEEVKYPHLVGLGCGFLRILAVKDKNAKRVEQLQEMLRASLFGGIWAGRWESIIFVWAAC